MGEAYGQEDELRDVPCSSDEMAHPSHVDGEDVRGEVEREMRVVLGRWQMVARGERVW